MHGPLRVANPLCVGIVVMAAVASYPYGSSRDGVTPPVTNQMTSTVLADGGELPVFAEWIAHGSGCHATSTAAGDVSMERITTGGPKSDVYVVRFHLDQLQLTTAGRPLNEPLDFAKECAIRIQVIPPAGKRIQSLYAQTSVVSVKAVGTKLTLAGTLKIGAQALGQKIVIRPAGTAHAGEEAFVIFPGSLPEEAFPVLRCEENKLAGFDFTWIAERKEVSDAVFVEVADSKILDMVVELEDCD